MKIFYFRNRSNIEEIAERIVSLIQKGGLTSIEGQFTPIQAHNSGCIQQLAATGQTLHADQPIAEIV